LHRDYNDLLREFNEGRVEYLIVGAHHKLAAVRPRDLVDAAAIREEIRRRRG
jgi:hypothetical protein